MGPIEKTNVFLFLSRDQIQNNQKMMEKPNTQSNLILRQKIFIRFLKSALLMLVANFPAFAQDNLVTYAGGTGNEKFNSVFQLSDGTLLISGQADNLGWLPTGVPVNTLTGVTRYQSNSSQGVGFILHLSSNQQSVLGAIQFPANTVSDIFKIKTNSIPGTPTGDIFISGSRDTAAAQNGYYIAKLDNNFIGGLPTSVSWYRIISARNRNGGSPNIQEPPAGNESSVKIMQPWDVNSKGQILYAKGQDFSFDFAGVNFMNSKGEDTLMQYFSVHSPDFTGVPVSSFVNSTGDPAFNLKISGLVFKYSGDVNPGALRSYSSELFNSISTDENGNPGRKGAFPNDAFFGAPQFLGGAPIVSTGPGYTGYNYNTGGGRWTARISSINFDRRNNNFFIGFSMAVSSVSNQTSVEDAEPAVAAFSPVGEIKWWARLHKEDANRSSAQQHVEGLEIDYANDQLVVLGRTKGNSINNFWKGNELKLKSGGNGVQNQLTGNFSPSNPLNYGWLGKYDLNNGKIKHSTYIGEIKGTEIFSGTSSNQNYDGFPDLNSFNFELGNTYVNTLSVNPFNGEIIISGTGERIITTRNAYQKMFKPLPYQQGGGISSTNAFIRVYNPGLDTIKYSSLVSGLWNPSNGSSDNSRITGVWPLNGGIFFSGFHTGAGGDVATILVPTWGSSTKENQSALFGRLNFNNAQSPPAQADTIVKPADLCTGNSFTFSVPPVTGASSYKWVIDALGWTGNSTTNSITLTRAQNAISGFLTVYAVNSAGISLARMTNLPANENVNAPSGFSFPANQCINSTQTYQVNSSNGAIGYNWSIVGTGCGASWALANNSTSSNVVSLTTGSTVASPCSLQVVAVGCSNSSSPVLFPLPQQGALPNTPVFASPTESPCIGIPKTYSLNAGNAAVSYVWTVSGNGFSGASTSSSIDVLAFAGATGGQLSVVAVNACGQSPAATLVLGDATSDQIPAVPTLINGPSSGFCNGNTQNYSTPLETF